MTNPTSPTASPANPYPTPARSFAMTSNLARSIESHSAKLAAERNQQVSVLRDERAKAHEEYKFTRLNIIRKHEGEVVATPNVDGTTHFKLVINERGQQAVDRLDSKEAAAADRYAAQLRLLSDAVPTIDILYSIMHEEALERPAGSSISTAKAAVAFNVTEQDILNMVPVLRVRAAKAGLLVPLRIQTKHRGTISMVAPSSNGWMESAEEEARRLERQARKAYDAWKRAKGGTAQDRKVIKDMTKHTSAVKSATETMGTTMVKYGEKTNAPAMVRHWQRAANEAAIVVAE